MEMSESGTEITCQFYPMGKMYSGIVEMVLVANKSSNLVPPYVQAKPVRTQQY